MTTIKDVAKLAGVGQGTASRALSGIGSVSEESRKAVMDAARKLSFSPSATARALSNGQSGIIGTLTPTFGGQYFSTALTIAEREIRAAGKHMVVISSAEGTHHAREDVEGISSLKARGCDGILMLDSRASERDLIAATIGGPPIALVNRDIPSLPEMCFSIDHFDAGRAVGQYLAAKGHKDLAVVGGPLEIEGSKFRYEGFLAGLAELGVSVNPRLCQHTEFSFEGGRIAADALIAAGRPFTALFCGSDDIAIGAKSRLEHAGVRPEIVGYDNLPLHGYIDTVFSSVATPDEEMVRNACAYLLNKCYGGQRPIAHRFKAKLVIRDSVDRSR